VWTGFRRQLTPDIAPNYFAATRSGTSLRTTPAVAPFHECDSASIAPVPYPGLRVLRNVVMRILEGKKTPGRQKHFSLPPYIELSACSTRFARPSRASSALISTSFALRPTGSLPWRSQFGRAFIPRTTSAADFLTNAAMRLCFAIKLGNESVFRFSAKHHHASTSRCIDAAKDPAYPTASSGTSAAQGWTTANPPHCIGACPARGFLPDRRFRELHPAHKRPHLPVSWSKSRSHQCTRTVPGTGHSKDATR